MASLLAKLLAQFSNQYSYLLVIIHVYTNIVKLLELYYINFTISNVLQKNTNESNTGNKSKASKLISTVLFIHPFICWIRVMRTGEKYKLKRLIFIFSSRYQYVEEQYITLKLLTVIQIEHSM